MTRKARKLRLTDNRFRSNPIKDAIDEIMIPGNRLYTDTCWHTFPALLFIGLLMLSCSLPAALKAAPVTSKELNMYQGEVRVLAIGEIERVAIGNPKVASNTILPNGQLVILAGSPGDTTMHIWLKNGLEEQIDIVVSQKRTLKDYQELSRLLKDIPGVSVERIGQQTVVKGRVSDRYKASLERILARYKNILNLVQPGDTAEDIALLLEGIPSIKIRDIGGYTVISGEISKDYAGLLSLAEKKFSNVLNMTRVKQAVASKMIYMKVRIMEIDRSFTDQLGINWDMGNVLGPSFQFGVETVRNGGTILNAEDTSKVFTKAGVTSLTTGTGYFGIATGITSMINLSETTGKGIILAEPSLSTRSGGKATFLAGGEYPVPTSNSLGATNVVFKKHGISLEVSPVVDDEGNIIAHVETEISTPDKTNAVDNIPGITTRRTSTDVSLRSGQTLVIAGLVEDLITDNSDKVKWLGDLPILGPLFSSRNFLDKKTELVIFITPTVFDASSETNRKAMEQNEKIKKEMHALLSDKGLLE